MARTPLFDRLPKIFHRLDDVKDEAGKGVFQRFLEVLDSGFDLVLAKATALLGMRSVDKIYDKYLHLMAPIVGHVWRDDDSKAENRRWTRNAIHRHSYKGTQTRLLDEVAREGGTQHVITDQASKLLVWGCQGMWGCDDCAWLAPDYFHDGAMLIDVNEDVDLEALMEDMAETCAGGERWYARALDGYGTLRGGWFGMDDTITLMSREDLTMGEERLLEGRT
jgi:hypothetical protein